MGEAKPVRDAHGLEPGTHDSPPGEQAGTQRRGSRRSIQPPVLNPRLRTIDRLLAGVTAAPEIETTHIPKYIRESITPEPARSELLLDGAPSSEPPIDRTPGIRH